MAANDLTTLDNVKRWLKITTTSDDALLSSLITAASQYMETYCDREFVPQQFTEIRDGKGTTGMSFAHYPVTAISKVMIGSLVIPPAPQPGDPGYPGVGYVFSATRIKLQGYYFWAGVANVELIYTAGYVAMPADLVQCCNELVGLRYRQRDHVGLMGATSVDGQHIGYDNAALSPAQAVILGQYKRVVPL
ncbi:hypothetical protein WJ69_07195 [Burkholderia ubonensis]|uniref:head-tail connector protein n=1 Tax=Burkholderia ubonensis TaxID=101571 RepID=UPI00075AB26B|nr:head-tail connector protein [Burkholderia ubonensis]KVN94981.1 hypothetical protein WJ69_07195 [Burkholderia ubonensis]